MSALGPLRLRPASDPVPTRRAVFLDRDGVLNEVPGSGQVAKSPRVAADVHLVPDAGSAVGVLRAAGFITIVVTNQPDVARGRMTCDDAIAVTDFVVTELGLDDGYVCMHDDGDGCHCRKPRPGMLLAAADDWQLDLGQCWLVGDRWVDIAAASAASSRSLLLERPYSWQSSGAGSPADDLRPTTARVLLADAVEAVIRSTNNRT